MDKAGDVRAQEELGAQFEIGVCVFRPIGARASTRFEVSQSRDEGLRSEPPLMAVYLRRELSPKETQTLRDLLLKTAQQIAQHFPEADELR